MGLKAKVLRAGLDALYYSRAYRALAPWTRGLGAIFTLHRVLPASSTPGPGEFNPNGILAISPEFLDVAITRTRAAGIEIVSLDTVAERLASPGGHGRFVAFTLDDGYRDNLEHALPVFKRHGCPFTVYVATDFTDGTARLWWVALERIIAGGGRVSALPVGQDIEFDCRTIEEKNSAYKAIYWRLRAMDEESRHQAINAIARAHDFDISALAGELAMTWKELALLAAEPLATIGAHTVSHPALASLDEPAMVAEITRGRDILTGHLGVEPRHFAYPYGDPASAGPREFDAVRALGFKTGVTTAKGMLFGGHHDHLAALPRISLNGDYQAGRYVDLFLSGAPFALLNHFRRINCA
ncbi:MAG: polysaccharide deacetylase family protein [Alphaproteobacteria bacterium]